MSGECAICLEPFTDPRIIPCGHTFCLECVKQLISRANEIRCPKCRKMYKTSVESLPPNWEIRSESKSHRTCGIHLQQKKYWCNDCSKSVCAECLLEGEHKQHHFIKCELVIGTFKAEIEKQLQTIAICKQNMQCSLSQIDDALESQDHQFTSAEQNIKAAYQELLAAIKDQMNGVIQLMAQMSSSKKAELNQQRAKMQQYIIYLNDTEQSYKTALASEDPDRLHPIELQQFPSSSSPIKITHFEIDFQPSLPEPPAIEQRLIPPQILLIVSFKYRENETKAVLVSPSDKMTDVKQAIAKKFGLRTSHDLLLSTQFTGKPLRDELSVANYNLQNNTRIVCRVVLAPEAQTWFEENKL